jgi:hypothetical protein
MILVLITKCFLCSFSHFSHNIPEVPLLEFEITKKAKRLNDIAKYVTKKRIKIQILDSSFHLSDPTWFLLTQRYRLILEGSYAHHYTTNAS